jgi:hypothetical protein
LPLRNYLPIAAPARLRSRAAQHQNVHIVVLDALTRAISVMAKAGADSRNFIAATAAPSLIALPTALAKSGSSTGLSLLVPDVDYVMLEMTQIADERQFHFEAGMVRTDDNAHRYFRSSAVARSTT